MVRKICPRAVAALAIALTVTVTPLRAAFAWGAEGHQAIAELATSMLTDRAKSEIATLLDEKDVSSAMIEASTWADTVRFRRPDTGPWHYTNIPVRATDGYRPDRDCRDGNCVVGALRQSMVVAADQKLLPARRAEALRWIIHLVADIHQPLHCADNGDHGGNDVAVMIGRQTANLHALWDNEMVKRIAADRSRLVAILRRPLTNDGIRRIAQGGPEAWATESWSLAKQYAYAGISTGGGSRMSGPILLPTNYMDTGAPVAEEQLRKAAVRLALTLNSVFAR